MRLFSKVVFTLTLVFLIAPQSGRSEVHFKSISFAEAKKLAAKEHKNILVDYYTDWCSWCKVLDKKTYTDANVGKIADAKFISVKINAEKGEGIELAKSNKVSGYPTIVFYTADGKEIERVVGYQDADHFARSLNMAAAGGTQSVLTAVKNDKNLKDASKWLIAADFYAQHQQSAEAQEAFRNVIKYDPDDKQNLREEAVYGLAFLTDGEAQFPALEQALMQYPKRDEARQAVMLLLRHDFESARPEEASRLMDMYAAQHPDDANTFNYFAWTAAEKGVALPQAMQYAERALALSPDPTSRAEVMDTKAELIFKMGRPQEAAMTETQALELLDPQKDAKLYKDLSAQKAKFEQSTNAASGSAPMTTPH